MKPRFKVGNVLKFENDAIINIFKVSQINIDKRTNNIYYITEDGKSYVEYDNLGLYKEQDEMMEVKGSNPLLDTPDKSVMPKHYNPLFNPTLDIPTTTTNCPSNNLPKPWEVLNM